MNNLYNLFEILINTYGKQYWWPAPTPFEMMVGAVLTQNTTWTNVEKAITSFGGRLSPTFIAEVSCDELAQIIRSSGYYNQKAIKLKALTTWYGGYGYDIAKVVQLDGELLRHELLAIKGIGPETADSILLYAMNKPFFVVDTYTKRILHRIGYDIPDTYDCLRQEIEKNLPRDVYLYNEFHALLVAHAKQYCKKKPSCQDCLIAMSCQKRI